MGSWVRVGGAAFAMGVFLRIFLRDVGDVQPRLPEGWNSTVVHGWNGML